MEGERIYDGDTVFVKETHEVKNNDIVVVRNNNTICIRKIIIDDKNKVTWLCASNSKYLPIRIDADSTEDWEILGRCMFVQFKL